MAPLTLEGIADATVAEGLASRDEITATVDELYRLAADPAVVMGLPRVVQAWGRRTAS